MATENRVLDVSYEAAEDLTNDQYRIMVLASGKVRRPDAATDIPLGVLQNAPAAGEAAVVRLVGISKIQFGGIVAEGNLIKLEYVSATDAGKGLVGSQSTEAAGVITFGDTIIARCLIGGIEDELGEVLLPGLAYRA